jgi:signal recognition particle receptor subunit beta
MSSCKLVIVGSFGSGKSTFVETFTEPLAVPKHLMSKAITMDFGQMLSKDGMDILYIYGVPGARRFDFMWELLAEGLLGFIVMIASQHPETFREAKSIINTYCAYAPIPYVLAANFQDYPDAWSVEDLRVALQIEPEIPIVPCIATDRESVKNVLLTLLDEVLKDIHAEVSDGQ